MLVSPMEQPAILKSLGKSSALPEKHGCDFLIPTKNKYIGVQRKRLDDFVASLQDGRLSKEVGQATTSPILRQFVVIIEGVPEWTNDGFLTLPHTMFRQKQWLGTLLSLQLMNSLVLLTDSLRETATTLNYLATYFSKEHRSMTARPNTISKSPWGTINNKHFASHLLQSFPGIGPKTADTILETLGVPLTWTVTMDQLSSVNGVGKLTAAKLIKSLQKDG